MKSSSLETPVLLCAFNRPDKARQVFEMIRKARPKRFYLAVDGPAHAGQKAEVGFCQRLADLVDWSCEVHTRFAATNQGCGRGMKNAIDWFFEEEEMGIILEDDCLPSESFFPFCEELLLRYRESSEVGSILGNNFGYDGPRETSYEFGPLFHAWGWATWRRAWQEVMTLVPDERIHDLRNYGEGILKPAHLISLYRQLKSIGAKKPHTWDAQWLFYSLMHKRLSICPTTNLVENIGFGPRATHTKRVREGSGRDCKREEMGFPLIHAPVEVSERMTEHYRSGIF